MNNEPTYIRGPIKIDVQEVNGHRLLSLPYISSLLAQLTPDECKLLECEMQSIVDMWLARKSIDGENVPLEKVLTQLASELDYVRNRITMMSKRTELDRHERASLSNDMYELYQMIEKYKDYAESGFIDF